jgi:hypothetical protein
VIEKRFSENPTRRGGEGERGRGAVAIIGKIREKKIEIS